FYNIVVAEQKNRRDGRFLERVGFYNPLASGNAETLRLSLDRVDAWVKTGAQASDAVNRLIVEAKKAAVPAA
ncbi:MAG: 30S ribosomal protein S16, partial [Aquabacterium sp.]|nr:30S ribosomal protein S16 [Aquabacterium sp.]